MTAVRTAKIPTVLTNRFTASFFSVIILGSTPSIGILLVIMRRLGATNMDILFNSNSGEMRHDNFIQTILIILK